MSSVVKHIEPLFRPPAEADSLIFQIAYGCPHNRCRFCGMYKEVKYRLRAEDEVLDEIVRAGKAYPAAGRIFLADGDVMALPFERLQTYLAALNAAFPRLARVNTYANGSSILNKTPSELAALKQLKLNTLYMGLESGSQEVLDRFGKTESVESMIAAAEAAQKAGLKMSVMILIGLGGREFQSKHIAATAAVLNRMRPAILSALRYIQIPGMPQISGYTPVSEYGATEELKEIIRRLELPRTVFRANHTSNPVPLAGRLPQDKIILVNTLEAELASGTLDKTGPGTLPLFL